MLERLGQAFYKFMFIVHVLLFLNDNRSEVKFVLLEKHSLFARCYRLHQLHDGNETTEQSERKKLVFFLSFLLKGENYVTVL